MFEANTIGPVNQIPLGTTNVPPPLSDNSHFTFGQQISDGPAVDFLKLALTNQDVQFFADVVPILMFREGFTATLSTITRPFLQASEAIERVLKMRTAHNHLSTLTSSDNS